MISAGDDRTLKIWKIPAPLAQRQSKKHADGENIPDEDKEYCILNIETNHHEPIYSICNLHETVATGSKDGVVKVYRLNMKYIKRK